MKRLLMVNNSTNINKMSNHLSIQAIEHTHKKIKPTYGIGNSRQTLKCGGVKLVNFYFIKSCIFTLTVDNEIIN